jgi:hypothetical protein
VSARPIGIDVGNSTLSIGALPDSSVMLHYGYAVDILVAQNPHLHDNWQIPSGQFFLSPGPQGNGFNYGLG